jgi:protein phosphatase
VSAIQHQRILPGADRLAPIAGGATEAGPGRARDEDAILVGDGRYAVADGVGGAPAGDLASALVIQALRRVPAGAPAGPSVAAAHAAVARRSAGAPELKGMGSTLVTALVREDHVEIAHIGDSRAYRLRDGALEQLTADHTLAAELVRRGAGQINPRYTSMITRWAGMDDHPVPDVQLVDARPGDVLLLCSDGISGPLDDATIAFVLRHEDDPDAAARQLVRLAHQRGGHDDASAVVVRLGG